MLGAKRILADQQRLEVLDRADHRQLAPGDARLADARDAFVGVHHYEQKVAEPAPDRVGLDVGDFHGCSFSCLTMAIAWRQVYRDQLDWGWDVACGVGGLVGM